MKKKRQRASWATRVMRERNAGFPVLAGSALEDRIDRACLQRELTVEPVQEVLFDFRDTRALKKRTAQLLESLTPREREVLRMRFEKEPL